MCCHFGLHIRITWGTLKTPMTRLSYRPTKSDSLRWDLCVCVLWSSPCAAKFGNQHPKGQHLISFKQSCQGIKRQMILCPGIIALGTNTLLQRNIGCSKTFVEFIWGLFFQSLSLILLTALRACNWIFKVEHCAESMLVRGLGSWAPWCYPTSSMAAVINIMSLPQLSLQRCSNEFHKCLEKCLRRETSETAQKEPPLVGCCIPVRNLVSLVHCYIMCVLISCGVFILFLFNSCICFSSLHSYLLAVRILLLLAGFSKFTSVNLTCRWIFRRECFEKNCSQQCGKPNVTAILMYFSSCQENHQD